jgi:hypothetical protein
MGAAPMHQTVIGPDVMPAGENAEYLNPTTHIDKAIQKEELLRVPALPALHYKICVSIKTGIFRCSFRCLKKR